MSERRNLPAQAAAFRRGLPTPLGERPAMSEQEMQELSRNASQLLANLSRIGKRFLVSEGVNQGDAPGLTAISITPSIRLRPAESEARFSIFVVEDTYMNVFSPHREMRDIIEFPKVTAGILLEVPESENPLPIIMVDGYEMPDGTLVATQLRLEGSFFQTEEERVNGIPVDQNEAIEETSDIAREIEEILDFVSDGYMIGDRKGDVLLVRDALNAERTFVISHA